MRSKHNNYRNWNCICINLKYKSESILLQTISSLFTYKCSPMKTVIFCILFLQTMFLQAKQLTSDSIRVAVYINGTDTMPFRFLSTVTITDTRVFKSKKDEIKYTKLRRDVLKVLPYARIAGEKFRQLEYELSLTTDNKVKRELIKRTEKEIKDRFENDLKNLTITQGKILIKLLDRETGNTGYELLKDYNGNFSAFLWQSLARVFGSNLKTPYDLQTDRDIESIIQSQN